MKNLTKAQKILIVLSILWEIIALVISYQTQRVRGVVVEYLNLKDFILASLPVHFPRFCCLFINLFRRIFISFYYYGGC